MDRGFPLGNTPQYGGDQYQYGNQISIGSSHNNNNNNNNNNISPLNLNGININGQRQPTHMIKQEEFAGVGGASGKTSASTSVMHQQPQQQHTNLNQSPLPFTNLPIVYNSMIPIDGSVNSNSSLQNPGMGTAASSSVFNPPVNLMIPPPFPSMDSTYDLPTSSSKIKRRSRSFSDLKEVTQYSSQTNSLYFYPYPHASFAAQTPSQNFVDFSDRPATVVNGKIAIRRAPEHLLGKPVHIVTKEEKKMAHSAMERKYRKELNMQIKKLREIVPSCSEKTGINLHKVEILKLTAEYIRHLKEIEIQEVKVLENERLGFCQESGNNKFISEEDEEQLELQKKIKEQQELIDQQQLIIQGLTEQKLQISHNFSMNKRKSFIQEDFDIDVTSLIDSYVISDQL